MPFFFCIYIFLLTYYCISDVLEPVFLTPHVLRTISTCWIALSISSELSQWQQVLPRNCQQHSEDLIAILNWHSELEDQYQKSSDDRHRKNGSMTLGNSKPVHIWHPYCQYCASNNRPNPHQSCEKPKTCSR